MGMFDLDQGSVKFSFYGDLERDLSVWSVKFL